MKIILFIDKLYGGGAERVASILLNHLCEKHKVTAIVFNDKHPTYPLNPKINIQKLTIYGKTRILHPIKRIAKIRYAIKQNNPDLVISFLVKVNGYILLSNIFHPYKIIVSERTSIQRFQSFGRILTRYLLYKTANKVVLTTKDDYCHSAWLRNKVYIYNPCIFESPTNLGKRENNILAIGAQNRWHVKGFDLLIQAWAKIAKSHPDWKLQFVGAQNNNKISILAKSYDLETQVDFLGWTDEIDKILQTQSIYVLSSRNEGFPNSLIEAMSQGCACVAFDCKTGPNEIITNGKNGILARNGDVDDLSSKIKLLIEDKDMRLKLANSAMVDSIRFDKNIFFAKWDKLIVEVCAK